MGKRMRLVVDGEALARARLAKPLTVAELADAAGLSPERIYQWQTGSHPGISPRSARRLAQVLEVEVDEFARIDAAAVAG